MPRRYVDGLEANGNRVAVTGIGTAGNTGTEIDRIDALDRLTGVTSAGGSTAEYEYDPNGNRTRLTNTPSDGTTGRIARVYDAAGRPITATTLRAT